MSIQEFGLIISLLGNVILVIGWIYNHNRNEELEKQLLSERRKHEVKDREIESFRKLGEGFVSEITKVLTEIGDIYISLSTLAKIEKEDLNIYRSLYERYNEKQLQIEKFISGPDYQRFKEHLPNHMKSKYELHFLNLHASVTEFTKLMVNLREKGNYGEVSVKAFNVAKVAFYLASFISINYSQLEKMLIGE